MVLTIKTPLSLPLSVYVCFDGSEQIGVGIKDKKKKNQTNPFLDHRQLVVKSFNPLIPTRLSFNLRLTLSEYSLIAN